MYSNGNKKEDELKGEEAAEGKAQGITKNEKEFF